MMDFCDFTVLFHVITLLLLLLSHAGQLQVVSPSQPIVALVGDDIILPCHLEPAIDASDVWFEWTRPDLRPKLVHMRANGREYDVSKHPSYRGRTSVLNNKLKLGDVSLNISNVKISDEGTYRCLVPKLGRDAFIQLVVGAVSSPVISIINIDSSVVVLQCESKGWYPEPEVSWLDSEGHVLSVGPTETVRGPDGHYDVSSRVTVEETHGNSFTCRVQQKKINQTRETQIYISVLSRHLKWILVPGLLSILVCAGLAIYKCRKRHRHVAEKLSTSLSDVNVPWDTQKESRPWLPTVDTGSKERRDFEDVRNTDRSTFNEKETAANQTAPTEEELKFCSV